MKTLLASIFLIGFMSAAHAQDYGLLLGVHETTATAQHAGLTTAGDFNFKVGIAAMFPLTEKWSFRSGIIYDERHFDLKDSASNSTATLRLNYIDVPILVQYHIVPMFGVFGGLVAAVNVSHGADGLNGQNGVTGTVGFIPLVQAGVNATFNDQFGLEIYYERGLGDLAKELNSFSTFGLNFLYWF